MQRRKHWYRSSYWLSKYYRLTRIPMTEEIDFILETATSYLAKTPTRADVLSVFAGLRPLAAPQSNNQKTKEISRGHKIIVSASGLISVIGGKWTTYRKMAEDTVDTIEKKLEITHLKP